MTDHEQKCFNDALHKLQVAEMRNRVMERAHHVLEHDLSIKLAQAKVADQMPLLFRVEKALGQLLKTSDD